MFKITEEQNCVVSSGGITANGETKLITQTDSYATHTLRDKLELMLMTESEQ